MNTITIKNETFYQLKYGNFNNYYISKLSNIIKKLPSGEIKHIKQSQNSKNNPETNYLVVSLYKDNKTTPKGKKIAVHQLMCIQFLEKPEGKNIVVNHKDGNKQNNILSNLEWTTQQDNIKHSWRMGFSSSKTIQKTVHQYSMSGEYIATFKSLHEAEKYTKTAYTNISKCIKGLRKSAGGYKWSLKKVKVLQNN